MMANPIITITTMVLIGIFAGIVTGLTGASEVIVAVLLVNLCNFCLKNAGAFGIVLILPGEVNMEKGFK